MTDHSEIGSTQYGKIKILFDTFVSDPIPVNRFIYRSWLEGLTEKETASRRDSIEKTLIYSSSNNINIIGSGIPQPSSTTSINNSSSGGAIHNSITSSSTSSLHQQGSQSQLNVYSSTASGMNNPNNSAQMGSWQQLLEETEDQFRNFSLLSNVLEHPKTLSTHTMFQMDPVSRRLLIEGYYDFDDVFMRELIGRKLTSGQRRDLDDTSEKLRIRLSTCERQFDNLKRISRIVFSDIKNSSIDIIMNEFSLSRELSKKYVKILFLCFHRIDISHKRVLPLSTIDLMQLSEMVMNNWGDPLKLYSMELDIKLKEDVRDLKVYLSKDIPEKYWKLIKSRYQQQQSSSVGNSVGQSPKINSSPSPLLMTQSSSSLPTTTTASTSYQQLPQQTPPMQSSLTNSATNIHTGYSTPSTVMSTSTINTPSQFHAPLPPIPSSAFSLAQHQQSLAIVSGDKLKSLENKFKSILKGVLSIGSSLSDPKDFRNVFEDVIEKVIDPLKRIDMTLNEADTLFIFIREVFVPETLGLSSLRHKDRLVYNWKSFLEGIRALVLFLYDR